jgi:hypothetical protein
MSYLCPYCSTLTTYESGLRRHLSGKRSHDGHEFSAADAAIVVARVAKTPAAKSSAAPGDTATRSPLQAVKGIVPAVRRGHWRSVELLENTQGARDTLAMYERATGHPVYLRPTEAGLTVMSLDPLTTAMIGAGGNGDGCIDVLPPTLDFVELAARAHRGGVAAMVRASAEERYVIGRIRAALARRLELDDNLFFLHQEWRLPSSNKIDVLALDRHTGQLVVIEVKKSKGAALRERDRKGRSAAEQAEDYVAQLTEHGAECMPFFQRLASALGRMYRPSGEALRVDMVAPARCEVWWPPVEG